MLYFRNHTTFTTILEGNKQIVIIVVVVIIVVFDSKLKICCQLKNYKLIICKKRAMF